MNPYSLDLRTRVAAACQEPRAKKAAVARHAACSYEALKEALREAIDWISKNARNWFDHGGYHTQPT